MSSVKLGYSLMKVPTLDVAGLNWVIYKDRFLWSIDARRLLDHVDGSALEPKRPVLRPRRAAAAGVRTPAAAAAAGAGDTGTEGPKDLETPEDLSAAETLLVQDWEKKLKEWKQGEAIVKQQIAASIPDSLFIKIRGGKSALEIWEALSAIFQNKSRMVAVNLRQRLQLERCGAKGDVRAHFTKLRTMREELAALGQAISDDDFYTIILGSLPSSFDSYVGGLNATVRDAEVQFSSVRGPFSLNQNQNRLVHG